MATSGLRPLSLGEILDAGIKVFTRNWKPLVGSMLVVSTPVWFLFVLLLASVDSTAFEFVPDTTDETTSTPSDEVLIGFAVSVLLLVVAFLVSFVALFKGVCDAWLGLKPTIKRSLRFGLRRSPKVLLLTLIWYPCVILFCAALCFPGLWLTTVWSLSIPALLFERVGPFKALGRSYSLIRGRFWASLLIVLVCVALTYIVSNAVQLPLIAIVAVASGDNGIANAISQGVGATLGAAVTYPYMAAVLTILYFDQRVRKEGFDIQLLAQGIGVDPDAPLPAPLAPARHAPQPPQGWQPQGPQGWQPPPSQGASPSGWSSPPGSSPGGWSPAPGGGAAPGGSSPAPGGASSPGGSSPAHRGGASPRGQNPSPGGAPPPGVWSPPSHEHAPPPLWGGSRRPPAPDDRPPDQSPWMTPSPGGAPPSRWAPSPPPADPSRSAGPSTGEPRSGGAYPAGEAGPGEGGSPGEASSGDAPSPGEAGPGEAGRAGESSSGDAPSASSGEPTPGKPRWGGSSPFGESPWGGSPWAEPPPSGPHGSVPASQADEPDDEEREGRDERRADRPPDEPRGPGGL